MSAAKTPAVLNIRTTVVGDLEWEVLDLSVTDNNAANIAQFESSNLTGTHIRTMRTATVVKEQVLDPIEITGESAPFSYELPVAIEPDMRVDVEVDVTSGSNTIGTSKVINADGVKVAAGKDAIGPNDISYSAYGSTDPAKVPHSVFAGSGYGATTFNVTVTIWRIVTTDQSLNPVAYSEHGTSEATAVQVCDGGRIAGRVPGDEARISRYLKVEVPNGESVTVAGTVFGRNVNFGLEGSNLASIVLDSTRPLVAELFAPAGTNTVFIKMTGYSGTYYYDFVVDINGVDDATALCPRNPRDPLDPLQIGVQVQIPAGLTPGDVFVDYAAGDGGDESYPVCLANVTTDQFLRACFVDDAALDSYVAEILGSGDRPPDEVIWIGRFDEAPVKP